MDPQIQNLSVQLAETAVRNTANAVGDRIRSVRARKQDQDKDTIAELEDIVNDLVSDKNELVRIARSYEDELVAQRISADDIEYIASSLVPILRQFLESSAAQQSPGAASVDGMIDLLQPLLSVETVTVFQLLGFNFREAIGKPLTDLVAQLIASRAIATSDLGLELQRLNTARDLAYLEIAADPDAFTRLNELNAHCAR